MPGVEPDPPRCKRGALPVELHPQADADGWSANHHSQRRWRYRPVGSPMLSVRVEGVAGRTRTGVAGITTRNAHRCTTATAGTAGLEPAASRLTSERSGRLSYAPIESRAGGIRTHGLELMRLARTTAPLPRSGLAGRTRTCDLRLPGPVGWPAPPQPDDERRDVPGIDHDAGGRPGSTSSPSPSRDRRPPVTARSTSASLMVSTLGGTRTRSLRVENPASSPASTTRACKAPAAGIEPAISRVTTARLAHSTTPD